MKKFTLAISTLLISSSLYSIEEITLSHFLPKSHPIHSSFFEPWAKKIEKCSNNEIKINIYAADSKFGNVHEQLNYARNGSVDISHGFSGATQNSLPRTMIIESPLLLEDTIDGSNALWEMYERKIISSEYRGLKVLGLYVNSFAQLHTNKEIKKLEDLKGLTLRYCSKPIKLMFDHFGANSIAMAPTQVYESLDRGLIDGTTFPWSIVDKFKLYEKISFHKELDISSSSFYFVMNKRKYQSLSPKVQQCIDDNSGSIIVNELANLWQKWEKPGKNKLIINNSNITKLDSQQRKEWLHQLQPVQEEFMKYLEQNGVRDPNKLYEDTKEILAEIKKNK